MAQNSDQRTRAAELAVEIVNVGKSIQQAAKPPLETSSKITRTSDQGNMGILSPNPNSLGDVLRSAKVALRELEHEIDQLLKEDAR